MQESVMKAWWDSSHMAGANAAYVEELYETYLEDPQSVSENWRQIFDNLPKVDGVELETNHTTIKNQFTEFVSVSRKVSHEIINQVQSMANLSKAVDVIASNIHLSVKDKQMILEKENP